MPKNKPTRRRRLRSTSGHKNIYPKRGKWMVQMTVNYQRCYIGIYSTLDEAVKAEEKAEEKFRKEYERKKIPFRRMQEPEVSGITRRGNCKNKWKVDIGSNGKGYYLGSVGSFEEALELRKIALAQVESNTFEKWYYDNYVSFDETRKGKYYTIEEASGLSKIDQTKIRYYIKKLGLKLVRHKQKMYLTPDDIKNIIKSEKRGKGTGIRGITLNKITGKYRVRFTINGIRLYLGEFENIKDAEKAKRKAEKEHNIKGSGGN